MVSIDKLYPYAYFLSEKIAQILSAKDGDIIQLTIPNFEHQKKMSKSTERLKYQIYQNGIDEESSYRFKFIIIGDHRVGKTSLIRRFVDNIFLDEYRTTIGLNILSHNFEAFGNKVDLSLWDIGAQRYFKRYRKTYYRGAQAAFIVFDVTSRESFDNIKKWTIELNEFIEEKNIPIVIVGNKIDLIEQRVVSHEEATNIPMELSDPAKLSEEDDLKNIFRISDLAEQPNQKISYIETSALTGENVQDAFNLLAYQFIEKSKEFEDTWMKEKLYNEINSILKNIGTLTLSFLTDDPLWSPCIQILTEIKELGKIRSMFQYF
jgi:small GTP-binding protein